MAAVLAGADPWFINLRLSSLETRAPFAAVFGHNTSGAGSEGGVILSSSGRLAVTATTPSASMALSVSTGHVVVPRANNYVYVCTLPTAGTVDVPAANPTNPRIDTVIARVRDPDLGDAAGSTGLTGFAIEVVTGTPAASPVAPDLSAIPACIPLQDYRVPAGATQITTSELLTDRRYYTRAAGGIRYSVGSEARTGAYPWEVRVSVDGRFDAWDPDSAVWVPLLTARTPPTYTPTWTMGNPVGQSTGWYQKTGRMVEWDAVFVAQAGVSLDTVPVEVTLPFPAASATGTAASLRSWSTGAFTYPAGLWRPVDVVVSRGVSSATLFGRNGSGQQVTPGAAGFSLAAGDSISVSGRYWAAS